MNRPGILDMESYRLADYSVAHPCYICEGGNNHDADNCRHCGAPMALAKQASQKKKPTMLAAVGSAGAGKTVYLGMLADILSRENSELQILPRGSFSIAMQQTTMQALVNHRFPAKTPTEPDHWNWIHCQVTHTPKRKQFELIMPDLAGEALIEEIDHANSFPAINQFLSKCSGVMLVVDAYELECGQQEADFFATKIVSYLCELDANNKTGWPSRPISIIFSKADQCDGCFDDPTAFAKRYAPSLWMQAKERLKKFSFFATGVAGSCAYLNALGGKAQIPLRVEPRGVVPPFQWLTEQLM